jgi:hypothetical protein
MIIHDIDYSDIDSILAGLKGTLYYVSGCMMFVCRCLS